MSIKLDWTNPNTAVTKEIRVYRSLSKITDLALSTLVATLSASAVTYTDAEAPLNTVVHYQLVFVGLDDQLFPFGSQAHGHFPNGTGPGQQTMITGSWEAGYFGTVPTSQIYTPDELRTELNTASIAGSTVGASNAQMTLWHKFVYDGKIVFYPQGYLIGGIRWSSIYNKGWMHGIDGPGPRPMTSNAPADVNQKVLLTKSGFTYRVRTPKGLNKPVGQVWTGANNDDYLRGSEWDSLLSACRLSGHSRPFNVAGLGRLKDISAGIELTMWMSITQHAAVATDVAHSRGSSGVVDANGITASGYGALWMPVLQLEFI